MFFRLVMTGLLLLGISGSAWGAVNPNTAPEGWEFDEKKANGSYTVSQWVKGSWQPLGQVAMDRFYREHGIDVVIAPDNPVRLRIRKSGGGAAQLDSVSLGGEAPVEAGDALKKIAVRDLDVYGIHDNSLELSFATPPGMQKLLISGRIEAVDPPGYPFKFPLSNCLREIDPNSEFYSYLLNSNSKEPLFKEFTRSGTGHPRSYTYGWVANDRNNLYVTIDFTGDNTMDGGKDFTEVFVNTTRGVKRFKMSENDTLWGNPQFTYTDKVPFQHKVYSYTIPFSKLGTDARETRPLELAFSAYGTLAYLPALEVTDGQGIDYVISDHGARIGTLQKEGLWCPISYESHALNVKSTDGESSYTSNVYTTEDGNREVVFSEETLQGLSVRRKAFVPTDGNFVRYLNILTNPGDEDVSVDVEVSGQYRNALETEMFSTQSGDRELTSADDWMVVAGYTNYLVLAHIWDGPYGQQNIGSVSLDHDSGLYKWSWPSVNVPAGGTVILMYYVVPQEDGDAATAQAEALSSGTAVAMLDGLSEEEKRQVINWALADDDGISKEEENGAPNGGDGNDDSIPDSLQAHVASMKIEGGASYATLVSPEGTILSQCQASPIEAGDGLPGDISFDWGQMAFSLQGLSNGAKSVVTITLEEGAQPDTYYKFGPTPDRAENHWYEFLWDEASETGAKINGNVITLYLKDGARGDSDLTENGVIADPGAPGFSLTPATSSDDSDSGCFVRTASKKQ